jgi:hypothetical protein
VVIVFALILFFSFGATRAADGEVPTAAGNEEAPQAVKAGAASRIMGDRVPTGNSDGVAH